MCIDTHTCTYTQTGKSDNKSGMIISYNDKGGAIYKTMK